jgi:hypothetical protein
MKNKIFLTASLLDPDRNLKINNCNESILKILPQDYIEFLSQYGEGIYCNEVTVQYPDENSIPETFKDYADLWEVDETFTAKDLLNAIQIGYSFNGDILCVTKDKKDKVFILPRHDIRVTSYDSFYEAINWLTEKWYDVKFYSPYFDGEHIEINLIKENKLKDIISIHNTFISEFNFDFSFDESTQPQYVLKSFGFWIRFDLIYKNAISIGYQKQFKNEIKYIIDRIEELSK